MVGTTHGLFIHRHLACPCHYIPLVLGRHHCSHSVRKRKQTSVRRRSFEKKGTKNNVTLFPRRLGASGGEEEAEEFIRKRRVDSRVPLELSFPCFPFFSSLFMFVAHMLKRNWRKMGREHFASRFRTNNKTWRGGINLLYSSLEASFESNGGKLSPGVNVCCYFTVAAVFFLHLTILHLPYLWHLLIRLSLQERVAHLLLVSDSQLGQRMWQLFFHFKCHRHPRITIGTPDGRPRRLSGIFRSPCGQEEGLDTLSKSGQIRDPGSGWHGK